MIRPNVVLSMDSSMADLLPSAVCADRDLVKGVIGRWKFKDQVEFLENLHIKFQNFYLRGLSLARVRSPYLQKIVKRVPGRTAACHHFEVVDIAASYISEHLRIWHLMSHEHGIQIDPVKKNVKCNYCDKVVSGFHRFKCHLGVGIDVKPCLKVPTDVKEVFEAVLLEKKMNNLNRSLSPRKGMPTAKNQMSSLTEGKQVAGLVKSSLFWKEATIALKASMPPVCALDFLYKNNKPQTGFVSKIISQAKGKIKLGFNDQESHYAPFAFFFYDEGNPQSLALARTG